MINEIVDKKKLPVQAFEDIDVLEIGEVAVFGGND